MTNTEPVAWVMPGDCNEDVNGFLPARINREGEFTKPLYPESALLAERERADYWVKQSHAYSTALHIEQDTCGLRLQRAEKAEAELAAIKEALRNPTPEMIKDCGRRLLRFQDDSTDESFSKLQWAEVKQDAERVIAELAAHLLKD